MGHTSLTSLTGSPEQLSEIKAQLDSALKEEVSQLEAVLQRVQSADDATLPTSSMPIARRSPAPECKYRDEISESRDNVTAAALLRRSASTGANAMSSLLQPKIVVPRSTTARQLSPSPQDSKILRTSTVPIARRSPVPECKYRDEISGSRDNVTAAAPLLSALLDTTIASTGQEAMSSLLQPKIVVPRSTTVRQCSPSPQWRFAASRAKSPVMDHLGGNAPIRPLSPVQVLVKPEAATDALVQTLARLPSPLRDTQQMSIRTNLLQGYLQAVGISRDMSQDHLVQQPEGPKAWERPARTSVPVLATSSILGTNQVLRVRTRSVDRVNSGSAGKHAACELFEDASYGRRCRGTDGCN